MRWWRPAPPREIERVAVFDVGEELVLLPVRLGLLRLLRRLRRRSGRARRRRLGEGGGGRDADQQQRRQQGRPLLGVQREVQGKDVHPGLAHDSEGAAFRVPLHERLERGRVAPRRTGDQVRISRCHADQSAAAKISVAGTAVLQPMSSI